MPTVPKAIADAMVGLIQAIPGAPSLVEWRKADVLHPNDRGSAAGDPDEAVIITGGPESDVSRSFENNVVMGYPFQVSVYAKKNSTLLGTDTRPSFLKLVKNALAVRALAGTPVWDFKLAQNSEWESAPFGNNGEVSRFGIMYLTSELGNS